MAKHIPMIKFLPRHLKNSQYNLIHMKEMGQVGRIEMQSQTSISKQSNPPPTATTTTLTNSALIRANQLLHVAFNELPMRFKIKDLSSKEIETINVFLYSLIIIN